MKHSSLVSNLVVPFLLAALAPPALAGGVRIVEATGTQNFSTLQAAVDAAPAGAVLLVGEGSYAGFSIVDKTLSIFAVPGATVAVDHISIYGTASDKDVVVSGLSATAAPGGIIPLQITYCDGTVHVQDGDFRAQDFQDVVACRDLPSYGGTAAIASNSRKVTFSRCSFTGGKAQGSHCEFSAAGGSGLQVSGNVGATVVLYDCQLQGGAGGDGYMAPGQGGAGLQLVGTPLFVSNCTFTGGEGGAVLPGGSPCAGGGGAGLRFLDNSTAHEIGSTFLGGCGAAGVSGNTVTSLTGPARVATIEPTVQADASTWSIDYQGAPGDRPLLLTALAPQTTFQLPLHGAWLLRRNTRVSTKNFGLVDASGAWSGTAPTGELVSFSVVQRRATQVAVRAMDGVYLGSARDVILLNRDGGPDCNGNGVSDFVDVIENPSLDLNHNLIPDSCPGG